MGAILHFGTDGWRARADAEFTEANVARVADAAGSCWERQAPGGTVYVGYDTRLGADFFARVAAEVLAGHGLAVKLSDRFAPTPALSWAVAADAAACGGLMVTGSHNPMGYLGIKLRVADGAIGSADFYDEIERLIPPEAPGRRGAVELVDFCSPYLASLVGLVDMAAIAQARPKVVYDPMYGAASGHFSNLLVASGVETAEIHSAGETGWEDIHPEPIEPWVDACEHAVVRCGADVGLINDGDADRVGAVDENGRFVNQQKIIALLLGHLAVDRGMTGSVVLNLSTSVFIRRIATRLGLRVIIKPVGFTHIYREMRKGGVLIAGEEAGGIAVPALMPERDGLLMNLLLLELMAQTGKSLGTLVAETEERFGDTYYARRDLRLPAEDIEMLRTMLPGLNPPLVAGRAATRVSHMDGLRMEFEDESWLLLRPSGTEPLVRVYAEAPSIAQRDELLDAGCEIARRGMF